MKRISPQRSYPLGEAYPTAADHAFSRRRFFGGLAAAAAGVVGALAGPGKGQAAPTRGAASPGVTSEPTRIRIDIPYSSRSIQGDLYPQRLDVFTKDPALIRFFGDAKERAGVQKSITSATAKAIDEDFYDGKRLFALEQRIAKALAKQVERRTKRRVPNLDLMLYVGEGRRWHIRTGGVSIRPHRPRVPVVSP